MAFMCFLQVLLFLCAKHVTPTSGHRPMGKEREELPPVDSLEACDRAAERLRELANHLNHGEIPMDVLQQSVGYAVCLG
ncbi:hypothetical protein CEXT_85901 [Caerostris extrusa]|uniref:Uncharacterized protein n=1 Tax=Caerostris extrusa TaxID=172846 RepID=A0AAV4MIA1_CAEEX|nr:hypothetical protein CEXT_85901 [Caerostris extrusa]